MIVKQMSEHPYQSNFPDRNTKPTHTNYFIWPCLSNKPSENAIVTMFTHVYKCPHFIKSTIYMYMGSLMDY